MSELTFLHIVRDLDNDRLRKIVASMREPRVALYRLIILALTIPYLWLQSKAAHPMIRETSEAGIWVVAALLPVCLAWWLFVRRRTDETSLRFDIIGIVMDGVIAMIVLKVAFVVLIWFNSLWPLILVRVSALYPRRVFVPATVLTLVAMLLAAPGNYWLERPAYFIYGAVVNVVMPLTMDRIFVALRAIALQAVVSQKAQLRFIGAMSHEMRTPLNAVINATSLIEPERLDAEQREMFSLVTTNADTLLERVNSVLDIAAIGAGKLVVTPAPTSIEAVLRSVYAACSASAAEGAVSLCDTRSGPVETVILSDAGRLNQILINLVGNAIKFTPPGGRVTVESTVAAVGDHLDVRFRVIDTGKGVPDAYKARIFEAFHQAEETTQTSRGGVGLGLHIAKTITDLMGGSLSVHDNPGGGAMFEWFGRFLLAPKDARAAEPASIARLIDAHRAGLQRLRLLVIDDQVSNQRVLRAILERAGHDVVTVDDVDDGMFEMRQQPFDAALVDLHLPGRSGFDFLDSMTAEPGLRGSTALVVVSADTLPDVMDRAKAKGATAFLKKPVSPAALFEVLTTIAGQRQRDAAAEGDSRPTAPTA
jgi:two-component system sensor histidine kinase RpfC